MAIASHEPVDARPLRQRDGDYRPSAQGAAEAK